MKIEQIYVVERECKRLIDRIKTVKNEYSENKGRLYGSKHTGALKRASMDLTRALADLRR